MCMIKAIIFDCFGVLAIDGWLPFKKEYFGKNPQLFEEATDLNKRTDAGLASYDDFIRDIARLAKVDESIVRKRVEDNPPNTELFDYITSELRPAYRIGLLSNAGANWLNEIFKPEQVALFDATSLSFESGFIKPDVRAFKDIVQKLGVDSTECVFIDDQERYCDGAREVGMPCIVYRDFSQFKAEIDQILSQR